MRAAILLVLLVLPACECAQVPDDLCLLGECDGGALGGGRGGGGASGGGGGGGALLGGGGGASSGGGGGPRPLFCDDWTCVAAQMPPRAPGPASFELVSVSLATGVVVPPTCGAAFLGGVLMGDDSVLAIPNCADHFMLIDVAGRSTRRIGPALPEVFGTDVDGGTSRRTRFGGGVLSCDGSAIILPLGSDGGFRVWLDGGVEPLALPGRTLGGVLTGSCSAPSLSYGDFADGAASGALFVDIPLDGGTGQRYPLDPYIPGGFVRSRFGDGWGVRRSRGLPFLPYDLKLVGPLNGGVPQEVSLVQAGNWAAGSVGLTSTGSFYVVDVNTGNIVIRTEGSNSVQANGAGTPTQPVRYPVARGDGFIYAVNFDGLWIYDEAQVLLPQRVLMPWFVPEPFAGLVVHPSGVLVAIPSQLTAVVLLVPDGGVVVPGEVLRSPYFNKL